MNPGESAAQNRDVIALRGAQVHNLQSVSVDFPHNRLTVCTGVSGSGKSSLAFDTLFAEGQRRCLETLSASVRHRVEQLPRPQFDSLTGLPPVVAVSQRNATGSPRSTLATLTEIASFLRLLYARAGQAHCPQCGQPVSSQSTQVIVDSILSLETGRKVMILAPRIRGRKGAHRELFESIVRDGFVRARVDGQIIDAASPPALAKTRAHDIEVVVDRIIVKEGLRSRLHESVDLALRQGNFTCVISHESEGRWHDRLFSSRHACPDCQISLPELEPRTLSFNSPRGACPRCDGLGRIEQEICPECAGTRLAPAGRGVTFAEQTLPEFLAQTVTEAGARVAEWNQLPSAVGQRILPEVTKRLQFLDQVGLSYLTLDRPVTTLSGGELQRARLAGALGSGLVGVCYVLDEPTMGLHARDTARLLLALLALRDQGNTLVVVEHDLDVISQADHLIDLGPGAGREGGRLVAHGTVEEVKACRDSLTARFLDRRATAAFGNGRACRPANLERTLQIHEAKTRNLRGLSAGFPLGLFTCVTGVSGSGKSSLVVETLVPLVRDALKQREAALRARIPPAKTLQKPVEIPGIGRLLGANLVTRLVEVDQSPLGRSSRATPATLTGIWTEIRRLLARTREARQLGFTSGRFSFQSAAGRCSACRGLGSRRIAADLFPEAQAPCPVCRGARFNPQTLQVKFRNHDAAQLLNLRIDEALEIFANFDRVRQMLQTLVDVGLGYLLLGQPASTLSGGEAQRVKLAMELGLVTTGHTLYILDEPTTGLHPADVERLLELLQRLVDQGHTVIVIEHHLELISSADWIIDLGPEGGAGGGEIIAAGTPRDLVSRQVGQTALALARR